MKIVKKAGIFTGFLILGGIVSIPFWPERYGDSYSEKQRQIWNEQMDMSSNDEFFSKFPGYFYDENDMLGKSLKDRGESAKQLQLSSAPDWNTEPPATPDLSILPLEGMTFDELLRHAESQHDANAFLLLLAAPSLNDGDWYWSNDSSYKNPVNQQLQFMRKWITKAHELKRPGAGFLLAVLNKKEEAMNGMEKFRKNPKSCKLEDIPGYADFKRLIDSGDFSLYKALITIRPELHQTELGQTLESTLEKKARQGDITAQRQLGEYGFLDIKSLESIIANERKRPRNSFILWLSEKSEKWCPHLITIRKTMDSSPTRDKLDSYAVWLKKAANSGDLTAMHLWLTYGVETFKFCSRKDWEDILGYSDCLLKTGYEQGLPLWEAERYHGIKSRQIIDRYYSPQSLEKINKTCAETLFARGSESQTYWRTKLNDWSKNSRGYNLNLLEKVRRQNPGILIGFGEYLRYMEKIKDNDVRKRFADVIRETANGGDPLFMAALADMIRRDMVIPEIPDEARLLLERAWTLCSKYNSGFFYGATSKSPIVHYFLAEFVVNNLMSIYLIDAPTPENRKKAFELAGQYLSFDDSYLHGLFENQAHFYLSLMHQKGYGTIKSSEKAKYHYEQFKEDFDQNTNGTTTQLTPLIKQFSYETPE